MLSPDFRLSQIKFSNTKQVTRRKEQNQKFVFSFSRFNVSRQRWPSIHSIGSASAYVYLEPSESTNKSQFDNSIRIPKVRTLRIQTDCYAHHQVEIEIALKCDWSSYYSLLNLFIYLKCSIAMSSSSTYLPFLIINRGPFDCAYTESKRRHMCSTEIDSLNSKWEKRKKQILAAKLFEMDIPHVTYRAVGARCINNEAKQRKKIQINLSSLHVCYVMSNRRMLGTDTYGKSLNRPPLPPSHIYVWTVWWPRCSQKEIRL